MNEEGAWLAVHLFSIGVIPTFLWGWRPGLAVGLIALAFGAFMVPLGLMWELALDPADGVSGDLALATALPIPLIIIGGVAIALIARVALRKPLHGPLVPVIDLRRWVVSRETQRRRPTRPKPPRSGEEGEEP